MPVPALSARASGFYGKLPSRGDFLRVGLPRGFTDPWDAWLQTAIAGSLALLGAHRWREAWMVAPVWRFELPGGECGSDRVLGVLMPSVDRAGRLFPLTLAMVPPPPGPRAALAWLDHAEAAGRAALELVWDPDTLATRLGAPVVEPSPAAAVGPDETPRDPASGVWWTDGSPLVAPTRLTLPGLPDVDRFAAMLIDPARMA